MPRSRASCPISRRVTGMPASMKFIAMPPPMVPAPMTPTLAIWRFCNPWGRPGRRAASRSAKKMWRSAADSGERTLSRNWRRSNSSPCAKGWRTAAMAQSMIRAAARGARDLPISSRRTISISASALAASPTGRSLAHRDASPARQRKFLAAASRSPSTISSISPFSTASEAGIGAPDSIRSSAGRRPIRRAERWVPPAPGTTPRVISGRPTLALARAMRWWQASASSRPPPSAVPWMAASTGLPRRSIRSWMTLGSTSSGLPPENSRMSAPTTKVRPAQRSATARTEAASRSWLKASRSPWRSAFDKALTGGLSMVTTAIPPSLRQVTRSLMIFLAVQNQASRMSSGIGLKPDSRSN